MSDNISSQRSPSPTESTFTMDTSRHAAEILSAQHQRLLFYLLPSVKDAPEFDIWLRRPSTLAAWSEFNIALPGPHPEPNLATITPIVQFALNSVSPTHARFRMLHPDKRDWNTADHYIRFIVAVIHDNLLEEQWDKKDWNRDSARIVRATYEVLAYLKAIGGVE